MENSIQEKNADFWQLRKITVIWKGIFEFKKWSLFHKQQ